MLLLSSRWCSRAKAAAAATVSAVRCHHFMNQTKLIKNNSIHLSGKFAHINRMDCVCIPCMCTIP